MPHTTFAYLSVREDRDRGSQNTTSRTRREKNRENQGKATWGTRAESTATPQPPFVGVDLSSGSDLEAFATRGQEDGLRINRFVQEKAGMAVAIIRVINRQKRARPLKSQPTMKR